MVSITLLSAVLLVGSGIPGVAPDQVIPRSVADISHSGTDRTVALAESLLKEQQGGMVPHLYETLRLWLVQEHRNLDLAAMLLNLDDAKYQSNLHRTITLAQAVSPWQAATLGLGYPDPIPLTGYTLPSEGLHELAVRAGKELDASERAELDMLDGHPEPLRSSLARFVDAFLAFETAAHVAFQGADTDLLEEWLEGPRDAQRTDGFDPPADELQRAGIDLSIVFPTRSQLLNAVLDLSNSLGRSSMPTEDGCRSVSHYPIYSINIGQCDDRYTNDVILLVDTGGDDIYLNNAGGNKILIDHCQSFGDPRSIAGTLIDLGKGDDVYGDVDSPSSCGVIGGGRTGSGLLLDDGGQDTYTAQGSATNGGANAGLGFLLDVGGNDIYTAGEVGANGGGWGGAGFLLDGGGDDTYSAAAVGTNGGGKQGAGFLLDTEGNDTYSAWRDGTNGGAKEGAGFLMDVSGDDTYGATIRGTNGGGREGAGFLLDVEGDDSYSGSRWGTNGGGDGGVGLLLDFHGDDRYTATSGGANGGVTSGLGLLYDGDGIDRYQDDAIRGGSCWDCIVLYKGHFGWQIDQGGERR